MNLCFVFESFNKLLYCIVLYCIVLYYCIVCYNISSTDFLTLKTAGLPSNFLWKVRTFLAKKICYLSGARAKSIFSRSNLMYQKMILVLQYNSLSSQYNGRIITIWKPLIFRGSFIEFFSGEARRFQGFLGFRLCHVILYI